ncbi:unnamed protein product, partial [Mesorhabditis belari]|uniref:Guanylate cyclase n=1 Tax=Mesorhabditis belari TaxID=2138241 RepID=A0AAF3EZD9_9BILA
MAGQRKSLVQSGSVQTDGKKLQTPFTLAVLGPATCLDGSCNDGGLRYVMSALSLASQYVTLNSNQTNEISNSSSLKFFADFRPIVIDNLNQNPVAAASTASRLKNVTAIYGLTQNCDVETAVTGFYEKMTIVDNCGYNQQLMVGFPTTSVFLSASPGLSGNALSVLISQFGWSHIGLISPLFLSTFDSNVRDEASAALINCGVSILLDSRYDVTANHNYTLTKVSQDVQAARVFVGIDPTGTVCRNFLLSLAQLGLHSTGQYFLICSLSYNEVREWIDTAQNATNLGNNDFTNYNVTDADMDLVLRNALFFTDGPPPGYADKGWENYMNEGNDWIQTNYGMNDGPTYWDRFSRVYDAAKVWMMVGAGMLDYSQDISNGSIIVQYMANRAFISITGAPDLINYYGFVSGSATIYRVANFTDGSNSTTWGFWAAGRVTIDQTNTTNWLATDIKPLSWTPKWISGGPPLDVPACGFHNELCMQPRDRLFIILSCASIVVVCILISIAAVLYRRYRFERRLHSLSFLIDRRDIILKKHVNILSTRSIRSIHDMRDSFVGHDAKGSHFLIGDFAQNFRRGSNFSRGSMVGPAPMDGFGEILDAGPIKEGDDPLDARWNNLMGFAVGMHEGALIGLKRIWKEDVQLNREVRKEIIQMQECHHENLLALKGMVVHTPSVFIVHELASRGSLKEILESDQLQLEDIFLYQMSKDIVTGLEFLHSSPIGCHGRLKSTNCLIDARWMVKLSSFGLRQLRDGEEDEEGGDQDYLWTAPEVLRWGGSLANYSEILLAKADIYSLSILLYEIFGRAGPWGDEPLTPTDILDRLGNHDPLSEKKPYRPDMTGLKQVHQAIRETIEAGWVDDPLARPTAPQIRRKLRVLTVGLKKSIMDSMVEMIEKYTARLERDITERNSELAAEKKKTEQLLKMMLPQVVAENLKNGTAVQAESFPSVTIYFSDCVGFTELSATSKPIEIVQFLNDLYTCFDQIIERFDVYKVETIADAYMVASGLPIQNGQHHAGEVASMALALLTAIDSFKIRHRPAEKVNLRIGMHSGPCVAGVVGLKMPRYCLFGDTVNTASRMESNGIPLRINCSQAARDILEQLGGYHMENRGLVEMKGKGLQMTYFVTGEDPMKRRERLSRDKVKFPTLRLPLEAMEKNENAL